MNNISFYRLGLICLLAVAMPAYAEDLKSPFNEPTGAEDYLTPPSASSTGGDLQDPFAGSDIKPENPFDDEIEEDPNNPFGPRPDQGSPFDSDLKKLLRDADKTSLEDLWGVGAMDEGVSNSRVKGGEFEKFQLRKGEFQDFQLRGGTRQTSKMRGDRQESQLGGGERARFQKSVRRGDTVSRPVRGGEFTDFRMRGGRKYLVPLWSDFDMITVEAERTEDLKTANKDLKKTDQLPEADKGIKETKDLDIANKGVKRTKDLDAAKALTKDDWGKLKEEIPVSLQDLQNQLGEEKKQTQAPGVNQDKVEVAPGANKDDVIVAPGANKDDIITAPGAGDLHPAPGNDPSQLPNNNNIHGADGPKEMKTAPIGTSGKTAPVSTMSQVIQDSVSGGVAYTRDDITQVSNTVPEKAAEGAVDMRIVEGLTDLKMPEDTRSLSQVSQDSFVSTAGMPPVGRKETGVIQKNPNDRGNPELDAKMRSIRRVVNPDELKQAEQLKQAQEAADAQKAKEEAAKKAAEMKQAGTNSVRRVSTMGTVQPTNQGQEPVTAGMGTQTNSAAPNQPFSAAEGMAGNPIGNQSADNAAYGATQGGQVRSGGVSGTIRRTR